nr:hypothetical protein [Tanacetum cinerariifolium]
MKRWCMKKKIDEDGGTNNEGGGEDEWEPSGFHEVAACGHMIGVRTCRYRLVNQLGVRFDHAATPHAIYNPEKNQLYRNSKTSDIIPIAANFALLSRWWWKIPSDKTVGCKVGQEIGVNMVRFGADFD